MPNDADITVLGLTHQKGVPLISRGQTGSTDKDDFRLRRVRQEPRYGQPQFSESTCYQIDTTLAQARVAQTARGKLDALKAPEPTRFAAMRDDRVRPRQHQFICQALCNCCAPIIV